jgi:RNA polymerase sigma-70 factor, ECF subfamily
VQEQAVKACIKRVIEGNDRTAFAELVDAHKNRVYNLCLKMTRSTENEEEVAQDTFLKAYQSIRTFQGKSKFSTWLYTITYYTCLNYLRKNSVETVAFLNWDAADDSEEAIGNLQTVERKEYLQKAFNYLTAEEVALMTLFYLEEHTIQEIATITTLSKAAIKVKLHRTRKKLVGVLNSLLKEEVTSLLR